MPVLERLTLQWTRFVRFLEALAYAAEYDPREADRARLAWVEDRLASIEQQLRARDTEVLSEAGSP
ncbi:hypothetical protein WG907_15835 [Sphingobium sp. AN558]|uniref:hypothetical protein n=1 Tax=Sphingobium sp. AN558 TaxID=3133442 RepID=UPI0030BC900D